MQLENYSHHFFSLSVGTEMYYIFGGILM